jgi:hypothetical protein
MKEGVQVVAQFAPKEKLKTLEKGGITKGQRR